MCAAHLQRVATINKKKGGGPGYDVGDAGESHPRVSAPSSPKMQRRVEGDTRLQVFHLTRMLVKLLFFCLVKHMVCKETQIQRRTECAVKR